MGYIQSPRGTSMAYTHKDAGDDYSASIDNRDHATDSVCVVDFNGRDGSSGLLVSFWADWDGQQVTFGGDWANVPNMPTIGEPSQYSVYYWARSHSAV